MPDSRFGVILSSDYSHMSKLGVTWFLTYSPNPGETQAGLNKVASIPVGGVRERIAQATLAQWAQATPGSVWVIGGEVNVPTNDAISPEAYVAEFDYYYAAIKAADPTARVSGPSILNWDFACTGCPGYTLGRSWMIDFLDAYQAEHQAMPPFDIWAIDAYPLTWDSVPMTNSALVITQLLRYREFLDSSQIGQNGKPIWVMEIASHWAYESWDLDPVVGLTIGPGLDWETDYRWDDMHRYMREVLDFLDREGPRYRIERWFLFATYLDIRETASTGYAGIYLLDGPGQDASLNRLGQLFREYATGVR